MADLSEFSGLAFRKMHGAGNDFVVLDRRAGGPEASAALARALGDRHRGVGADGILTLQKGDKASYRMLLHNADGSPAEVSGNGLRCFALFLRDIGENVSGVIRIETGLEISEVDIVQDNLVRVQMPRPKFHDEPPKMRTLKIAEQSFDALMLSVGNPHCVIFGPPRDEIFVRTYAWFLDTYPLFKDLYIPGNDLLPRWMKSRFSKDLFAEGIETAKAIILQGQEEGIFDPDLDSEAAAVVVYNTVVLLLSQDFSAYQRKNRQVYRVDIDTLLRILGMGMIKPD